jgi:magnesium-transporting ATPase (P-type)
MAGAAFGTFFFALARGLSVEAAQTSVVNTIVVMEVFYLFSLRFTHTTSLTLRGMAGTPAVLVGLAIVVISQAVLTYAPFMQAACGTRGVGVTDAAVILGAGVLLLLILEVEKRLALLFSIRPTRLMPIKAPTPTVPKL